MNSRKRRRNAFVLALLIGGAGSVGLVALALRNNVVYFYSPSDVVSRNPGANTAIRIGGLVKRGSVIATGGEIRFTVTDGAHDLPVIFHGLPPALFAEGQGVVATGRLNATGVLVADQVLAKHDERYMPPDVTRALKRSGHWQENGR